MTRNQHEQQYIDNEKLVYFALHRYYSEWACNEDLQQEARMALWMACLQYQPGPVTFTTFAVNKIRFSIANVLEGMHRIKRGGWNQAAPIDDVNLPPSMQPFCTLDWLDVSGFMNTLNPYQREIVRLTSLGFTRKEVGQRLGVSHQAVDWQLHKIRQKFDKHI